MHAGPVEAGPGVESRGEAGNSGHHPSSARTPAEQAGATSVPTSQTYYLCKIEMRRLKVIHVINGIPPKRNCQLPLLLSGVIL